MLGQCQQGCNRQGKSDMHSGLVYLVIYRYTRFGTYKIRSDLPGHIDEVYCVDFVADKVVSGGRNRTVKM